MPTSLAAALLLTGLCMGGSIHAQPSPRLTASSTVATAGFFHLSWETEAGRVELQEAVGPGFRDPVTAYLGPDRGTVISGKPDGRWYYRVRAVSGAEAGPWSEPVVVTVDHHPLSRALTFLALGIIVFVATAWTIVQGSGRAE